MQECVFQPPWRFAVDYLTNIQRANFWKCYNADPTARSWYVEACFSGEAKLYLEHHVCTTQTWCNMAAPTANFDLGSFNPQHALFLHALLNNLEKYSRRKLLDIGEKREAKFCWRTTQNMLDEAAPHWVFKLHAFKAWQILYRKFVLEQQTLKDLNGKDFYKKY